MISFNHSKAFRFPALILVFGLLPLLLNSCFDLGGVEGNGKVKERTIEVKEFSSIHVSGHFSVYISQGKKSSVVLEADENLHDLIDITVQGSKLVVETRERIGQAEALNIIITNPDYEKLQLSGAVELVGETIIESPSLMIGCSGAADIDLEINTEDFGVDISGAADIHLSGTSKNADFELSGASSLRAADLKCEDIEVDMSGAADATVHATQKLAVDISGAANCQYYGNPELETDISGAGNVKKAGS